MHKELKARDVHYKKYRNLPDFLGGNFVERHIFRIVSGESKLGEIMVFFSGTLSLLGNNKGRTNMHTYTHTHTYFLEHMRTAASESVSISKLTKFPDLAQETI